MRLRLHALELASRANGPGLRAVVWFQGCTLNCPGCFNPATHAPLGGSEADRDEVVERIKGAGGIEGVTFSGGEPFQQPDALAHLALGLRETGFSVLVFSGYTLEKIRAMPYGSPILGSIDVLVAGPYIESRRHGGGLIGSSNQHIHLLTDRYKIGDFMDLPPSEVIIHRDGSITLSGIAPLRWPPKSQRGGAATKEVAAPPRWGRLG